MKRFNIMSAKPYIKKDGTQAKKWIKLGSVVQQDDGKMFGDLDSIPLGSWFDGNIQLFEADTQNNKINQAHQNQGNQDNYQQNTYNNPHNYQQNTY